MTRGVSYENMVPSRRCGYIRSLREFHADFLVCRDVEAECHASSVTEDEYCERMRHAAFNLRQNPAIGAKVVHATENELTQGTIVGKIRAEAAARKKRFGEMLQEKYDSLNDRKFEAIVKCRRCGSAEVSWEEKQTRSADEGGTVFCICTACKNRWVMR